MTAKHSGSVEPRNRIGVVAFAFISLCAAVASAQQNYPRDLTLSWTNSSLYTDGTTIEPGELSHTLLQCDRQDGTRVVDHQEPLGTTLPGEFQSVTLVGVIPQPGTYTCVAYAVTIDSVMSDASNPATKKYIGKPQPPTDHGMN